LSRDIKNESNRPFCPGSPGSSLFRALYFESHMTEDKYQISTKAQYINFLLLKDELEYFDRVLSDVILGPESWLAKLRATRSVFLTLNNVKDAADRIQVRGEDEFVEKTRKLRKDLIFANHFRNRGIGHLNDTLLKRAVQWSPQIFYESSKDNLVFQVIEIQRTIIESCINSFIDKDGVQKVFGIEIDLMYPPNAKEFFNYLSEMVKGAIVWLSEGASILLDSIDHHSDEEIQELAAIAGQTNFDLKADTDLEFSVEEMRKNFSDVMEALEKQGTKPEILEFLRDIVQI